MSNQRYERISAHDNDDHPLSINTNTASGYDNASVPNSPPPSFRSRASSIASHHQHRQPLISDTDRTLADAFESPSDDESEDERHPHLDDRQRAMSGRPAAETEDDNATTPESGRPTVERRVTQLPVFPPATSATVRRYGGNAAVNDGVFANLSAKPQRGGDELDEKPPTYEQAAADAAPPYWETTILTPGGHNPDDVFIDGLPVGSLFSFVWNGMISMSFQLVGFLLTYLLHTTHAAKNGSKAGLGITLVQFGFGMKSGNSSSGNNPTVGTGDFVIPPSDPNSHDFDPDMPIPPGSGADVPAVGGGDPAAIGLGALNAQDWFAYALMIVGWFVLIKAISDYLKARRHEQLVLQSPGRGLTVPVVAEGERPESSV